MGFILQGTWIIQIGLALFSGWVAQGCSLHQLSRGNYTLRCKATWTTTEPASLPRFSSTANLLSWLFFLLVLIR
ncbi:uncharacterized protein DS421_15g517740 [Arachis hypogaea]|nr:uncharacterized protein DS421_15g517740 [Arachis hypogaea]